MAESALASLNNFSEEIILLRFRNDNWLLLLLGDMICLSLKPLMLAGHLAQLALFKFVLKLCEALQRERGLT